MRFKDSWFQYAALTAAMVVCAGAGAQTTRIRLMAANTTSGNNQSYDPGHGVRIFQALDPDIIMIQEFKYGDNETADIRNLVNTAFGTSYQYFREAGPGIPNGVISRYPILDAGEWEDTNVNDREFVWAKIDIPGDKDLWAVSVHLLTSSSSNRNNQATLLKSFINNKPIPATDYLAIGGDFNTDNRSESCINTLSSLVVTSGPYPNDGTSNSGKENTNAGRNKPYDWVLVNSTLSQYKTGVVVGSRTFTNGLVFDSRVYSPLSEVSPVLSGDSGASNMQHMGVVRDFLVPSAASPSPSLTPTPSPSQSPLPSNTPSLTPSPSFTPLPTSSPTPTPSPTMTATPVQDDKDGWVLR